MSRVVCWFSHGAASAVATKVTLVDHPGAEVVTIDTGSEHPDHERFRADCERWFDRPVTVLRSPDYYNTWDVWTQRRYINGIAGAPCTVELKKKVRFAYEQPDDVQVYGYTIDEQQRADRFVEQNPGVSCSFPLIDRQLTKTDCFAIIERAGIELGAMYRLGFNNSNCIGCPKGGLAYWQRIRVHFPAVFDRMAVLERELGYATHKNAAGPVWLDELAPVDVLPPDDGHDCGLLCALTEMELS